jgi:hypothetical protein
VRTFSEGFAAVSAVKGQIGYIDQQGNVRIPFKFEDAREFHEGLAAIKLNGKWGFIDRTGALVIQPQFEDAPDWFVDGMSISVMLPKDLNTPAPPSFYIRRDGSRVYVQGMDILLPYREGHAWVGKLPRSFLDPTTYQVIDQFQKPTSPPLTSCGLPGVFSEGLSEFSLGCGKAEQTGYVDHNGHFVIEARFSSGLDFSEGFAVVLAGDLYGYIKEDGTFLVKPSFDSAGEFSSGLAQVMKNGRIGFINSKGEMVISTGLSHSEALAGGFKGELCGIFLLPSPGSKVVRMEYINKAGEVVFPPTAIPGTN